MLETEFKSIAKALGATLAIKENKIDIGGGVRSPNRVFYLSLSYKDRIIHIRNATGTYFVGKVMSKITQPKASLEFEITTRSHFSSLFTRNKEHFRFKAQNKTINSFLRQSVGFSQLRLIAKHTVFEPTIIGKNSDDGFQIVIEYHLQFNNWWTVIKPITLFYKEFIDRFG